MILCLSLVLGITNTQAAEPKAAVQTEFIFATAAPITVLDPHVTYWSTDLNLADQVAEGLYCQDNTDPYMNIIPQLAVDCGTWSADNLEFTVGVRQGVKFHDGTDFNASAVVWNVDRILKMDELAISTWTPVLLYQIGGEAVINKSEVVDTYTVKFTLNYVFAPFVQLLSFQGFKILSPTSTPAAAEIDKVTGDLVGTGPFVYDGYSSTPTVTVSFSRNENYWNGKTGIAQMKWVKDSSSSARHAGLMAGDYDQIGGTLAANYPTYRTDPNLTFLEGTSGNFVFSITFNNHLIPLAYRKAMSYAFNYSYYLEEVWLGTQLKMTSPIPTGITYGRNDFNYPLYNLTLARQTLVDAGLSKGLTMASTDQDWIAVAEGADPVWNANISYLGADTNWQNTVTAMISNFALIGIDLLDNGCTEEELDDLTLHPENFDKISLGILGWGPDYADPSNMINPLFYPGYPANYGQVNDSHLTELMDAGLVETDPVARKAIYEEIQQYIIEELYPYIMYFQSQVRAVFTNQLENFYINSNGNLPYYLCTWQGVASTYKYNNAINCGGGAEEPFGTDTDTETIEPQIDGFSVVAIVAILGMASLILAKKYRR